MARDELGLGALDRFEEGIAVCDDLIARFGSASELTLCKQVAGALVAKEARLEMLDRDAEAIAVYDDLIARFGKRFRTYAARTGSSGAPMCTTRRVRTGLFPGGRWIRTSGSARDDHDF